MNKKFAYFVIYLIMYKYIKYKHIYIWKESFWWAAENSTESLLGKKQTNLDNGDMTIKQKATKY